MTTTPIPDLYQVKWLNQTGVQKWQYGIVDRWSADSVALYNESKCVIVNDAITPEQHIVLVDKLVAIPATYNPTDEYTKHVETAYLIASGISDSLPDGLHVGKLFRVPCGDGYAYYVITKVNKKTVHIEWRGYCLDRWIDDRFGFGGPQKRNIVEFFVIREDALHKIFSGAATV